MIGFDSAGLLSVDAAKRRAGGQPFVIAGYIGRGRITKAYIDSVFAAGGFFLPIWEEDGRPGDNDNIPEQIDYDDGLRQGRAAAAELQRLGYPNLGCAFTDDVSGQGYPAVEIWQRGVNDGFPNHIVFYGPGDKGDTLVDNHLADSVWLEAAASFTPRGYKGRHYCGVQKVQQENIGGTTVDLNEFYSTPWVDGQGQPPPEDDMTPQDLFNATVPVELRADPNNATGDEYLSAIGRKAAYWMCSPEAKTQARALPFKVVTDIVWELEEGNGGNGPAPDGSTRRAIDEIHEAVVKT